MIPARLLLVMTAGCTPANAPAWNPGKLILNQDEQHWEVTIGQGIRPQLNRSPFLARWVGGSPGARSAVFFGDPSEVLEPARSGEAPLRLRSGEDQELELSPDSDESSVIFLVFPESSEPGDLQHPALGELAQIPDSVALIIDLEGEDPPPPEEVTP